MSDNELILGLCVLVALLYVLVGFLVHLFQWIISEARRRRPAAAGSTVWERAAIAREQEEQAHAYELALWCETDDDLSLADYLADEYVGAVKKTTAATLRRIKADQELEQALKDMGVVLV